MAKAVIAVDITMAIMNTMVSFGPFMFADTLKALYIRTTIHIVERIMNSMSVTASRISPVDIITGSPMFNDFQRVYCPNLSMAPEKPVNAAIR